MSEHFDDIIAGAGSADARMASRLNEEPGSKSDAAGSCLAGQLLLDPHADAMSLYIKREVKPGPDVQVDEAMLEYCNNHGATIFHPSGTCKVDTDDVHPCTTGPLG